jgi:pimeloyl-ACP methyl ester carboxylesterase/DNA-binding CsgD family transcriptional regulator
MSRDGTRIAYATCRAGPPLVWVAPFSHHLKLDWENPIWRPWLALLTRRHSVVRFDWRGCGLSDRDGVEFSFERHIEDLESVVDAAGVKKFVLLGHEGGGTMCIAYTVRHPERVSHLVLNGSPIRGGLARAVTAEQIDDMAIRHKMVALAWRHDTPAFGRFHAAIHMPDASPEQQRAFNDSLHQTTSLANAMRIIETFGRSEVGELVARIRCPTLVLHARNDSIVPFDEGRTIAARIPGARFEPLETRNHDILDTEPAWQQLVEALDDFLPAADVAINSGPLPLDELTAREREILEFVAQGLDNNKIAKRVGISEKTVRNHVSTIFSKLGVDSRVQAVVRAREAGLGLK